MSDVFALDPVGNQEAAQRALANPANLMDVSPGFFTGIGEGVGKGIMRGGARAADFLQTVSDTIYGSPEEQDAGLPVERRRSPDARNVYRDAADYWTPKAGEVGTAGRVLGGLGEMVLPLMAGGGNPSLLLGTTGIETGKDMVDAGVSAPVAATVGTAQALATGLGFKIPVIGNGLASRLATGAGGNIAIGAAARKLNQQILERTGFEGQARQFDTTGESLAVDALSGLLFGGLTHLGAEATNPKLPQQAVDSILAARNAQSFQDTTAPGLPDSPEASIAHQDAITTALEQMSRNEPVNVGEVVAQHEGAELAPAGRVEESARAAEKVAKAAPDDAVTAEEGEPIARPALRVTPKNEHWLHEGLPVWEMSPAQLESLAQQLKSEDQAKLAEAFGNEEDAKRFARLASGSSESSYNKAEAMKSALPVDKAAIVDEWEKGGGLYALTHEDVSTLASAATEAQATTTPQELSQHLKYAVTRLGDATDPATMSAEEMRAYVEMRAGYQHALEMGWDTKAIGDAAVREAAGRFSDANDAEFMLKRFLREPSDAAMPADAQKALPAAIDSAPPPANTTPEIQALRDLAAQHPDAVIHSGYDEAGEPIKTTAAAEADRIQAEYEQDLNDAKAYEAAVSCFLGNGA